MTDPLLGEIAGVEITGVVHRDQPGANENLATLCHGAVNNKTRRFQKKGKLTLSFVSATV
jgi:hypothetical protein